MCSMFCKQLVVIMIRYWLCHKASYKERERNITCQMKLSMEPSIRGCKAGEPEWGRWCLLLIQNMHTHFHWLTAQYWTIIGKTVLFVYLSAGVCSGYWHCTGIILELKCAVCSTWAKMSSCRPCRLQNNSVLYSA